MLPGVDVFKTVAGSVPATVVSGSPAIGDAVRRQQREKCEAQDIAGGASEKTACAAGLLLDFVARLANQIVCNLQRALHTFCH